ncbi:MAG: hypothetical protein RIB60_06930 [Phycisphaerales bacterium]
MTQRTQILIWAAATALGTAFGCWMGVRAVSSARDTLAFLDRSVVTRGEIVSVRRESAEGGARSVYYPTVRFQPIDPADPPVEFEGYGSMSFQGSVGEAVDVRYDPDAEHAPRLPTWFGTWGETTIAAGLSIVPVTLCGPVLAFCLIALRPEQPKARRASTATNEATA